jgi:hypothetical protein
MFGALKGVEYSWHQRCAASMPSRRLLACRTASPCTKFSQFSCPGKALVLCPRSVGRLVAVFRPLLAKLALRFLQQRAPVVSWCVTIASGDPFDSSGRADPTYQRRSVGEWHGYSTSKAPTRPERTARSPSAKAAA